MQAFTSRSRHLVTGSPTFEAPSRVRETRSGCIVRPFGSTPSLKLDLATMEASAQGAGLVYLCNPNNPTATVLSARASPRLSDRVARVSPQTAVLVDEAYHEYVDDPSYRTSIPTRGRAQERRRVPHVFEDPRPRRPALRLRDRRSARRSRRLARFKLESSVNQLAIAAARAALGDKDRVERERTLNRTARESTRQLFESLGLFSGTVGDQFRPGRSPARFPDVPGRLPARWRCGGAPVSAAQQPCAHLDRHAGRDAARGRRLQADPWKDLRAHGSGPWPLAEAPGLKPEVLKSE